MQKLRLLRPLNPVTAPQVTECTVKFREHWGRPWPPAAQGAACAPSWGQSCGLGLLAWQEAWKGTLPCQPHAPPSLSLPLGSGEVAAGHCPECARRTRVGNEFSEGSPEARQCLGSWEALSISRESRAWPLRPSFLRHPASCTLHAVGLPRLAPFARALGGCSARGLLSSSPAPLSADLPASVSRKVQPLHVPTCLPLLWHSLPSSLQHILPPVLLCPPVPRLGLRLRPPPPAFLGWEGQERDKAPAPPVRHASPGRVPGRRTAWVGAREVSRGQAESAALSSRLPLPLASGAQHHGRALHHLASEFQSQVWPTRLP